MKLPEEFQKRMHYLLGTEYQEFLESYDKPRFHGLRVNTMKIGVEDFLKISPFRLTPVPWTDNGFYFEAKDRPAKHPYYAAGLYYLQEPSAMFPARILGIKPGDRVLDLCAAPGGKSTQAAAELKGQGILVSNDLSGERTKALTKNLDLFGVSNAVITNELPEKLAAKFFGWFNKILVDAPCSGEGMFRKDSDAVHQWGIYSSTKCSMLQGEILACAEQMLSPGGKMVYSTCTFAPEENEQVLERLLAKCPALNLVDIKKDHGFCSGRPEWAGGDQKLARTVRLWPHRIQGEGHFIALLEKSGEGPVLQQVEKNYFDDSILEDYFRFVQENLRIMPSGQYQLYGEHLYLQSSGFMDFRNINVVRPGLYLGMLKKNRFQPAHSLALALKKDDFQRVVDFPAGAREILQYLKGETLYRYGEKGWTAVCVDGFPLGWAKQLEGVLKNHYIKGWRHLS